jgi:hypothetical protein
MDDDRPWDAEEPSARADPTFRPVSTGLGVFTAVATPVAVYGLSRGGGPDWAIIAIGVLLGVIAGVLAGLAIERAQGLRQRGPHL